MGEVLVPALRKRLVGDCSSIGHGREDGSRQRISAPEHPSFVDLPQGILIQIMDLLGSVRHRNSAALVCRAFWTCERLTRTHFQVRGNISDLPSLPQCFKNVTSLDLSLCSPWGHSGMRMEPTEANIGFVFHTFPAVKKLKIYIRDVGDVLRASQTWSNVDEISLVRWHDRDNPSTGHEIGAELCPILGNCTNLTKFDLSKFFCPPDGIPTALLTSPSTSAKLKVLNLLKLAPTGFKNALLTRVVGVCPSLEEFSCVCDFDPRYAQCVQDSGLSAIGASCPHLRLLHLVDRWDWNCPRTFRVGLATLDVKITVQGLMALFRRLRKLRSFALLLAQNLHHSAAALEAIHFCCPDLEELQIARLVEIWDPDVTGSGIGRCNRLKSITIKYTAGFSDGALLATSSHCRSLRSLTLWGCADITVQGLAGMAEKLKDCLEDFCFVLCTKIDTAAVLQSLHPLKPRLKRLQLDLIWVGRDGMGDGDEDGDGDGDGVGGVGREVVEGGAAQPTGPPTGVPAPYRKDTKVNGVAGLGAGNSATWHNLETLKLWAPLGTLLEPLRECGLDRCPKLESIYVAVEGDCRNQGGPCAPAFGFAHLSNYPNLKSLVIDLSTVIGSPLSCPLGACDVTVWERFCLRGLPSLKVDYLEYWVPTDLDLGIRSLSLIAAGLLSSCTSVRKLVVHGLVPEHHKQLFIKCGNLRDAIFLGDFYPTPTYEVLEESLIQSYKRFEVALNAKGWPA